VYYCGAEARHVWVVWLLWIFKIQVLWGCGSNFPSCRLCSSSHMGAWMLPLSPDSSPIFRALCISWESFSSFYFYFYFYFYFFIFIIIIISMSKYITNFLVDTRFKNGQLLFNFKYIYFNFFMFLNWIIPSIFHLTLLIPFGWVTVWPCQHRQLSLKTTQFQYFPFFF
jgi:hypothetical protein